MNSSVRSRSISATSAETGAIEARSPFELQERPVEPRLAPGMERGAFRPQHVVQTKSPSSLSSNDVYSVGGRPKPVSRALTSCAFARASCSMPNSVPASSCTFPCAPLCRTACRPARRLQNSPNAARTPLSQAPADPSHALYPTESQIRNVRDFERTFFRRVGEREILGRELMRELGQRVDSDVDASDRGLALAYKLR